MKKYLVFTDLDGTLLNHHNYSFEEAQEALKLLSLQKIPLIIATSKTFSEVLALQNNLHISECFIVENGAGIYIPSTSVLASQFSSTDSWIKVSQSKSYDAVRSLFSQLKEKYPIQGFGDMSSEEVMKHTGLEYDDALNAMKRDYTEPFLLDDISYINALKEEVNEHGYDIVEGGRFLHLITLSQDKSTAMAYVTELFNSYYEQEHTTIALGDSFNDFSMLQKSDIGVLIPKSDLSYAPLEDSKVIKAEFAGPKGWNSTIKRILHDV